MGRTHSKREQRNRKAILLAHFGTSFPSALPSLQNIRKEVAGAFPGIETRVCFTSNMVRTIWSGRRAEARKWLEQGVPEEILSVQGFLGAVGNLQDQDYRTIIVQPTHVYHGEQFEDLKSYVTSLQSIHTIKKVWAPFEQIVLSRPALGTYGVTHDYLDDVAGVIAALGDDVAQARAKNAALLYVAHGNDFFSSGVFGEMLHMLRGAHPGTAIHIGMLEGYPGIDDTIAEMLRREDRRVLLKPFMITAGDHAHHDIDNPDPDSWRSRLEAEGFSVEAVMEGLGSNRSFAALFTRRIQETAQDHGIDLFA